MSIQISFDNMIVKEKVYIPYLNDERLLHIYLPNDYYENDKRYPVMVMYDGHNLYKDEDATYGKSWGLETYLENFEVPMIMVGIECSHVGNNRLIEFCPYTTVTSFAGRIEGTGEQFNNWICKDLKPYIDNKYRTLKDRDHYAIGGSSMGGLMAMHMVFAHNDVFSKAACLSPSISHCMDKLLNDIQAMAANTRVYMDMGEYEIGQNTSYMARTVNNFNQIHRALEKKKASSFFRIAEEGHHNEASWEKSNPVYMNYLWLDK